MNIQHRSLATSTTDLRRLQHISTSTSNLTLTKDSETETENGEIDYRDEDAFSQTDSESGDSEGENSSEENAISAETTRDQEHAAQTTGDGGSCIQSAANSAQNSAPEATARPDPATLNFNEPINMVQIVQHQEITRPQLKFDPMAAIPKRSFTVEPSNGGEKASRITSLVITSSGLLILADYTNESVKLRTMEQSAQPLSLCLNARPWDLAIYKDDVIAVTSGTNIIVLLSISTDNISIDRQVETKQRYWCVASDGQGDTLVVSTIMDHHGPAVVDVITIEGKVLWTLGTEVSAPKIRQPVSLCVLGRDVLVSDKEDVVHRLDVVTGTRSETLTHSDLKWPGQVAADAAGNIYIASNHQEGCVLVYSASGQWRKLLDGQQHGENERTRPQAVGITENGIIVSWERDMSQSVVIGFDL